MSLISISVIAIVIVAGRIGWRVFCARVGACIERDMRKEMFKHIQTLSLSYYKDKKVGGLLSYFTQDLQTIKSLFSDGFIFMTDLLVLGTLSLVFMFQMSWALTLCCAAPMAIFIVFGGIIGKAQTTRYKASSDAFENLSDFTEENLQGFQVIKSYRKEESSVASFRVLSKDVMYKTNKFHKFSSWLETGINLFLCAMYVIMISVGSYALITTNPTLQGSITDAGKFITYVGYNDALIWPMIAGGILINDISMARGAYKRISKIMDSTPDIVDTNDMKAHSKIEGNITFNNLTFYYPDSTVPALENISFEVKKGMTVGIIGRTGSGKSTIVNILPKLFNIDKGMVFIDGEDINDWKKSDLREHIGLVSQEAFLFSGKIKDSIAFSEKEVGGIDMDKVKEAAKFAAIDKDIEEFKDQYDTIVGEKGATLSGGQRQRVSIARAIYKNPDVLIMDDSLSAVDADTEKSILYNLKHERKDITTFIITHRVSSIEECDLILVLDSGKLAGTGTHKQLLKSCKLYADIVKLQELEKEVSNG